MSDFVLEAVLGKIVISKSTWETETALYTY